MGKSLLLRIAESCGGDPRNLTPWSAAKTGLDQLGTRSYDGLLALDGFRRDPDARQIKALLAIVDEAGSDPDPNGEYRWRGVLLSGSEIPFTAMFQRKKTGVPAALLARIVDIPATSGPHGLIDTLHGFADATNFARHLAKLKFSEVTRVSGSQLPSTCAGRGEAKLIAACSQKDSTLC
ncbi:hypothetical protein [Cypionkella sinensis]|uniref:DUF927 domain-containing protein n=1 Tax=Cypionkella sinensis TaxID=1756043 RepID=A0ABV7J8N2_9RHOB